MIAIEFNASEACIKKAYAKRRFTDDLVSSKLRFVCQMLFTQSAALPTHRCFDLQSRILVLQLSNRVGEPTPSDFLLGPSALN